MTGSIFDSYRFSSVTTVLLKLAIVLAKDPLYLWILAKLLTERALRCGGSWLSPCTISFRL